MASVAFDGVRKSFGPVAVIHGFDLGIADGEFVVLVGPSGCGKSTLLRLVAGLEDASAGTIHIDGQVVNGLEPKDRDIAMVFQNYALYPHMTVYDNLAYGLRNRGTAKAEIDRRVREAAEMLQLGELLKRTPRQLSGGQRQRVAMGRAMVRSPAAFLFDEPLSNLDAKLRVQMRVEIKKLQRRLGTTSLYVTHDQVEAMTMADRLVVMNAGRAEQIGTPMEVYERPASVFVAGFIGAPSMNLFAATVETGAVRLGPGLALPCPVAAAPGTAVTVGLRPEHIHLAGDAAPDFLLRLELAEALGADTLLHGRIAETGTEISVRLHGTSRAAEGDVLPLCIAPASLHLFDTASGLRMA